MIDTSAIKKLPRKFYLRPVTAVAKELLGKLLIKHEGGKILAGRIIEVEAYDGKRDQASHSFKGRTRRNEVMFYEGGFLYVYFTYGAHYCCNVVTGEADHGAAILIRAIEPVEGIERMLKRRFREKIKSEREFYNLTSGPGKVCQAFGLDLKYSGIDLTGDDVFIAYRPALSKGKVGTSRRIGISRSVELKWRFFEKGNPYLSR